MRDARTQSTSAPPQQVVKGTHLLFLYAEYTGAYFEGDMAALSAEPRDVEWHKICDPCQVGCTHIPCVCVVAPVTAGLDMQ